MAFHTLQIQIKSNSIEYLFIKAIRECTFIPMGISKAIFINSQVTHVFFSNLKWITYLINLDYSRHPSVSIEKKWIKGWCAYIIPSDKNYENV